MKTTHAVSWFELPVKDLDRAKAFYEAMFECAMPIFEMGDAVSAFFPADLENGGVGGCILKQEGFEPSAKGTLVYLNGGDDLDVPLSRVEKAGGSVLLPKTSIGPHGFMAHFMDTEGNKVALHSNA
ncbi:MAG: VOC family protein [Flavobacteriales bacterium]